MNKDKVVVIGGGFAGCAAAIAVAKAGLKVILLERTDMLLAGGNRAGHFNHNGGMVFHEELKAMGGGDILLALESIILHRLKGPDNENTYIYNCALAEAAIRKVVLAYKVDLRFQSRVTDVIKKDGTLKAVRLAAGEVIEGGVFVDCTGTTGGMDICKRYGYGCVMCGSFRCPVFGNRVSVATKAGARELSQKRPDGTRGFLGLAVCVNKSSLGQELRERLEEEGSLKIPLPAELVDYSKANKMARPSTREDVEKIHLSDIGSMAKCSRLGYLPLESLRRVPGLESVMIEDPMGGGVCTFVKEVSIHYRDNSLKLRGFDNLFLGGEKIGPIGGVGDCIIAGFLAGHNAARALIGMKPLILPVTTAIGDFIDYTGEVMLTQEGLNQLLRPGEGIYFERMKKLGLYTPDPFIIKRRIDDFGLAGILAQKLT